MSLAWEAFGEKNGAASLQEMRARWRGTGTAAEDPRVDYTIGCILLEQPFFLAEADWIPAPADWSRNIVRGKGYDARTGRAGASGSGSGRGRARCGLALPASPYEPQRVAERFGSPRSSTRALGRARSGCW